MKKIFLFISILLSLKVFGAARFDPVDSVVVARPVQKQAESFSSLNVGEASEHDEVEVLFSDYVCKIKKAELMLFQSFAIDTAIGRGDRSIAFKTLPYEPFHLILNEFLVLCADSSRGLSVEEEMRNILLNVEFFRNKIYDFLFVAMQTQSSFLEKIIADIIVLRWTTGDSLNDFGGDDFVLPDHLQYSFHLNKKLDDIIRSSFLPPCGTDVAVLADVPITFEQKVLLTKIFTGSRFSEEQLRNLYPVYTSLDDLIRASVQPVGFVAAPGLIRDRAVLEARARRRSEIKEYCVAGGIGFTIVASLLIVARLISRK